MKVAGKVIKNEIQQKNKEGSNDDKKQTRRKNHAKQTFYLNAYAVLYRLTQKYLYSIMSNRYSKSVTYHYYKINMFLIIQARE